jgi:hypothetical protein
MKYRPFNVPVGQIEGSHIASLLGPDEPVLEGEFVEYKRDWQSKKVARAAASFANSDGGGTLVAGIEAEKLRPTRIVGIEDDGGLEERVTNAIRNNVAPIPSFRSQAVPIGEGRSCIVVEVPSGLQPPYIFIPSGTVLVRTPTSSEPIKATDREAIDRLYRAGKRGEEWGHEIANRDPASFSGISAQIIAVPNVDGGLDGHSLVFRKSTVDRLFKLNEHPRSARIRTQLGVLSPETETIEVDTESVTVSSALMGEIYVLAISQEVVVTFKYLGEEGDASEMLGQLATARLASARILFEDVFDYPGTVSLGLRCWWSKGSLAFPILDVPVSELGEEWLIQRISREVDRARGISTWEPE